MMRIYTALDDIPAEEFVGGTAVAIGKFDAVHLGHQALIAGITRAAAMRDLQPVVFTFAENPLAYLHPASAPPAIMSQKQRLEALDSLGVAACIIVPFDARIANIPAEEYIRQVLGQKLHVKYLCVGSDFRYGRGGDGDVRMLDAYADTVGYELEVVAEVDDEVCGRVSSSRIRDAILRGDVDVARRMTGRPTSVRGRVVHGDARGRDLGFPTANLGPAPGEARIEGLVPADGVYAGWAVVDGERFAAAISVGVNLTFEPDGEPRVEAHLLDVDRDLYGQTIEVQFVARLRGMVAFAGVDELVARMHEDVRETRAILARDHVR